MNYPVEFSEELKTVLGEDTEKFLSLSNEPYYRGISVNRLKTSPEKLLLLLPFGTKKSPFYSDGYYIPNDTEGVGNLPLHHAGAFYVQEPSASSAVPLLEIEKDDFVLDLCAAPGGKSAQIASLLGGTGLVWSNEYVKNRSRILLSNFERMGISNGIVSSCRPDILAEKLHGCFDRVLVDAPCSGEGMFRRDPDSIKEWSREHVEACAVRQYNILISAAECVRDGGVLVYSTCTFSPEENEETVRRFLKENSDFEPYEIADHAGRKTEFSNAMRVTPLEGGEGHFAARFRKKGGAVRRKCGSISVKNGNREQTKLVESFLEDIFAVRPDMVSVVKGEKLYLVPEYFPVADGTGVIRAGVLAGEIIRNRIEPCHALFTSFPVQYFRRVINLSLDDERVISFLHGNEIDCGGNSGYTAVAFEGMTAGFGKCSGGRLKNKYPKGLRLL